MRKYRVIMTNALGGEPVPLGLFDTLLEANTWIKEVGKRDEHELGTYTVGVEPAERPDDAEAAVEPAERPDDAEAAVEPADSDNPQAVDE